MQSVYLQRTKSPAHLRGMSKKRDYRVSVRDGAITTFGTWWDGGSKSEYWLVELATGKRESIAVPTNPFAGTTGATIEPRAGWAVCKGGTFCGKAAQVYIYIWSFGDQQLAELQVAYLHGDCPWGIVADKMQELGLI